MVNLTTLLFGLGIALFAAPQDDDLRKKIDQLIRTLGDDNKDTRDRAVRELAKVGKPALEALRQAATAQDAEVKALAAQAIERIEWGPGLDKLKQYVKDRFEDGASVEPSKLKSIHRWFPELRFYEVVPGAAAAGGAVMMMGRAGGTSVFAIRKLEDGFSRILVKGIFCAGAFKELLRADKIKLADYDTAVDFGVAFLEMYWLSNEQMYMGNGTGRFEKIDDGWEFQSQNYTMFITFKTDKEGILTDIVQPNFKYWQQGGNSQKLGEEKSRLEIEKLKIEVELLRRQLEETRRK